MQENRNVILQITDLVSTRRCALRVEPSELGQPLSRLLQKYLKRPPFKRMSAERRITSESAETLASIQDLVYVSDDAGRLRDMFAGVVFRQGARYLELDEAPHAERVILGDRDALLMDVAIDRTNVGYDRNWVGFGVRRWKRHEKTYAAFVRSCLAEAYGDRQAEEVLQLDTSEHKLKLVEALARKIWESHFENYSRFVGRKLVYRSGDETVRNIIDGAGGICSEKVQALKFLTDRYGLESEYVLAGPDVPDPVPEAKLRRLLTTFDFRFARRYMRYWQHTALVYDIDGSALLVDDTNGNIPFLFLRDSQAERLLGYDSKPMVKVKMAVNEEDFYYHRVSQDIPEDVFFAFEGWIPYVDLLQVFDNELGLYISKDFMVAPILFRHERTYERSRREYQAVCERAGLRCSVTDEWRLDSPVGDRFSEQDPVASRRVMESKEHLLTRYDDCHGPGHQAGLVVIELRGR